MKFMFGGLDWISRRYVFKACSALSQMMSEAGLNVLSS
jgi:hypothetical protein